MVEGWIKAVLCADPRQLEAGLVERVCAQKRKNALTPIAVVAPTRRLLDRLTTVFADAGAFTGLHLLHHQGLARMVARHRGRRPFLREIPSVWQEYLLIDLARGEQNALERYLLRQPGARTAILATFRDLRDAGIRDVGHFPRGLSESAQSTVALFSQWQRRMAELESKGFGDGASLATAAINGSDRSLPFEALHHYGAYDLIGVHGELIRSLAHEIPTELWIPQPERLESRGARSLVSSLDVTAIRRLSSGPSATISFASAPGPRQEIRRAVRVMLSWHQNDGVPWSEMALVVRRLAPYRLALASECRALGVATEAVIPPDRSREPGCVAFRALLDALANPTDRRRQDRWLRQPDSTPARWDEIADAWRKVDTWPQALLAISRFAPSDEQPAGMEIQQAIQELSTAFQQIFSDTERPPALLLELLGNHVNRWLPSRVATPGFPIVREAAQIRGIPWRRMVLLGCNEGHYPTLPTEDSFLPDADRRRLRHTWGRPIPSKSDAEEDEELLFSVLTDAVSEQMDVSILKHDENGRSLSPSPYLRRFDAGGQTARRISPHPLQELDGLIDETGMATPREAWMTLALGDQSNRAQLLDSADKWGLASPLLTGGLEMLDATEAFQSPNLPFDGDVGAWPVPESLSVSAVTQLGQCPLRYLFRYGMGIEEPDTPTDEAEMTALESGQLVHAVLQRIYELWLPGDVPDPMDRERIAKIWNQEWPGILGERSIPATIRAVRSREWQYAILALLQEDRDQYREIWADGELEQSFRTAAKLPRGSLRFHGRFDRILRKSDGTEWICDYKTSSFSSLRRKAGIKSALSGKELQLALYWLARRQEGRDVERLSYASVRPQPNPAERNPSVYVELSATDLAKNEETLLTTLDVLRQCLRDGRFPLVSDASMIYGSQSQCGRCSFRLACRHAHAPTLHRVEEHDRHQDFYTAHAGKAAAATSGNRP